MHTVFNINWLYSYFTLKLI